MRAIFIAVGSELLDQEKIDTNSLYAAQKLMEKGILMDMKITVGDDMENLTWTIKNACKRAQLVIVTGGLGPTEDDITREAAANALKRELLFDEENLEEIKLIFKKRGIVMPEINARQAFVIAGAEIVPNHLGTAPGQFLVEENCKILLLPGPPREMQPMFDKVLEEKIAPLCNYFIYKRCFKFGGVTESEADAMIADIYAKHRDVRTTILAEPGLISAYLLGRSRKSIDETKKEIDDIAEQIKIRMRDFLVTEQDIAFEEYIVTELKNRKLSLSTAESCTGGGMGNRITNVPGSSDVFLGGVVAYSNELKMKILGVREGTLQRHGAVSRETAREMAEGIRRLTGSAVGLAITGIAGPSGASRGKPLGLVFMHLSAAGTEQGISKVFPGERKIVKIRAVNESFNLLKNYFRSLDEGGVGIAPAPE